METNNFCCIKILFIKSSIQNEKTYSKCKICQIVLIDKKKLCRKCVMRNSYNFQKLLKMF